MTKAGLTKHELMSNPSSDARSMVRRWPGRGTSGADSKKRGLSADSKRAPSVAPAGVPWIWGRGRTSCTYWQRRLVHDKSLLAPTLTPISPPRFFSSPTFKIAFCNSWETHGHPPSRNFWTEWTCRITACLRTTGGVWNHTALNLALTSLQQIPQEQSTSHQLGRLIVRLSASIFNLGLTGVPGGTSNLWKGYDRNTRR